MENEDENNLIPRARLAATGATIHDTNMYIGNIRNYNTLLKKPNIDQKQIESYIRMRDYYRRKLETLIATGDPKKAREI